MDNIWKSALDNQSELFKILSEYTTEENIVLFGKKIMAPRI